MISRQFCRYFSISNHFWQSSNKSLLAKLRKKTGYTFSNCKKALELHDNDFGKAEAWLKEQATALGWSKAEKLQGRSTTQGLIAVMCSKDHGAMVELNCETDFVARNKTFHSLAETIISEVTKFAGNLVSKEPVYKLPLHTDCLKDIKAHDGKILADHVALTIGNVGENITLKRALCMKVSSPIQLVGCTHPAPVNTIPVSFGKYGALLAFKSDPPNRLLGMQLCQHIIGMNPSKIGHPNDEVNENSDDESTLIFQEFLLDPSLNVQQALMAANAEVIDFCRFETGENLQHEDSDEAPAEKESVKSCS
ncbi:elongation factor Ts, mitochondrial [Chelonus insularis]|uniref:elongation factor Ts, mitochondrial n=1 Tax=Chelonus insularis TaxID=460826 RepID=UPI00158D3F6A|nr:elongation factor Ts, mitochondrial [Chelonus insularis]XP_034943365.1 elongation factor Ts, mitochondrial [Chelonus insularis]